MTREMGYLRFGEDVVLNSNHGYKKGQPHKRHPNAHPVSIHAVLYIILSLVVAYASPY